MQHPQLLTPPPPFTANQQQIVSQALAILETQLKHRPYTFNTPEAVKTWLKLHLQPQRRECFMVLFLDNRHRLIASETLSVGTFNATVVYPREVVIRALHHQAAAVVMSHNHPSGAAEPSDADRTLTDRLVSALDLVGTPYHDEQAIAQQIEHGITVRETVNELVEKFDLVRIDRPGFSMMAQDPTLSGGDMLRARSALGLRSPVIRRLA